VNHKEEKLMRQQEDENIEIEAEIQVQLERIKRQTKEK